jgi:hypothetical protein
MPLIEIEIIGSLNVPVSGLARKLADELGMLFGSAVGESWVRLRFLPKENYAENGADIPVGAQAIFVQVTKRQLPGPEILAQEARRISKVVAADCGRSADQVHVIYEAPGAGRIAFGGKLVE